MHRCFNLVLASYGYRRIERRKEKEMTEMWRDKRKDRKVEASLISLD